MTLLRHAAAALALFAAATVHAETINGSGKSITETRAVSGFRTVSISVSGRLEIVQGDAEKLTITGDDNILPLLETEVRGDELRIRFRERNNLNVHFRTPLRLALSAKVLEGISVAGSSDVRAPAVNTRRMNLSIAGSGDIVLGGKAQDLAVAISGSGDVKAGGFEARSVKVEIAGSGDATVWAREALKVTVAGSGDVRYYGDPQVQNQVAGSGSVRRLGATPG